MLKRLKRVFRLILHSDNRPPHEIHPEVKHWQVGDRLRYKPQGRKEDEPYKDLKWIIFLHKGLTSDGHIIIEDGERRNGTLLNKFLFSRFIRRTRNLSLEDRMMREEISEEYMALLKNFQREYARLQAKTREDRNDLDFPLSFRPPLT